MFLQKCKDGSRYESRRAFPNGVLGQAFGLLSTPRRIKRDEHLLKETQAVRAALEIPSAKRIEGSFPIPLPHLGSSHQAVAECGRTLESRGLVAHVNGIRDLPKTELDDAQEVPRQAMTRISSQHPFQMLRCERVKTRFNIEYGERKVSP
jgi:hypothetical protein